MVEAPQIAGLSEDRERIDRADPRDHAQELVVAVVAEDGMGSSLDLVALPDQATRLRDHHAEHGDRDGIFLDRQRDGRAGGLINIVEQPGC